MLQFCKNIVSKKWEKVLLLELKVIIKRKKKKVLFLLTQTQPFVHLKSMSTRELFQENCQCFAENELKLPKIVIQYNKLNVSDFI
jgi:hypothetical protein